VTSHEKRFKPKSAWIFKIESRILSASFRSSSSLRGGRNTYYATSGIHVPLCSDVYPHRSDWYSDTARHFFTNNYFLPL